MSMNLSLSKISSGYLVMLSFWGKNRKNACLQDFFFYVFCQKKKKKKKKNKQTNKQTKHCQITTLKLQ